MVLATGLIVCAGIGVARWASAADVLYTAAPIRGVVVSADTGHPLSGVSILVVWAGAPELSAYLIINTVRTAETESDSSGTFVVPGWQATSLRVPVASDSPKVLFFSAAHEPLWIEGKNVRGRESLDIRLAPFKGTPEEWKRKASEVLGALAIAWVPLYEEPPPRMLRAIEAEEQRLPARLRAGQPPSPIIEIFQWLVREYRSAHEEQKLRR